MTEGHILESLVAHVGGGSEAKETPRSEVGRTLLAWLVGENWLPPLLSYSYPNRLSIARETTFNWGVPGTYDTEPQVYLLLLACDCTEP